jgi:hypothetical protein
MTSPIDFWLPPSGLLLKDDFASNDAVADATISELRWELVTIGNASTPSYLAQQGLGAYGVLRLTTAATANGDGGVIRLDEDGLIVRPGTKFGAKIRYPTELASGNFRVGLQDSVTATSPTVGVWVDSDAGVLSCQVDSADHGDEAALVSGPAGVKAGLTSGTTMAIDSFYEFRVECSSEQNAQGGPKSVAFYGGLVGANGRPVMVHLATVPCNIDDDEEVEFSLAHWQDSGGADAVALDVDFVWLWIPR